MTDLRVTSINGSDAILEEAARFYLALDASVLPQCVPVLTDALRLHPHRAEHCPGELLAEALELAVRAQDICRERILEKLEGASCPEAVRLVRTLKRN